MAKDLPYFKFVISEWNDGDVTLCSMEAQGLFINLCSIYWSQEGDLSLHRAKRRFSNCNAVAWEELISERIIKLDGDNIVISFLDEQFVERGQLSSTNSENASKGWEKRRQNAGALRSENERLKVASNIEEKREEEKRKEKKREEPLRAFDVPFVGDVLISWNEWERHRVEKKQKLTPSTAKKQIQFLGGRAGPEIIAIINQSITAGWTGLFELKNNNNGNGSKNKGTARRADATVETGREFGTL